MSRPFDRAYAFRTPHRNGPEPVTDRSSKRLAALVGLVAVTLVGGLGTTVAALSEQDRARQRDRQLATVALAAMSDYLSGVATALSGVNGIAADGTVTDQEFQAFASKVVEASALVSLANVVIVDDRDRPAFEAQHGLPITQLGSQGQFVPAPGRAQYAVVVEVSPRSETNRTVLGFDIYSDPGRARAAATAAATGHFVLSDPVPLATTGRTGYFVIEPVFTPDGQRQPIGFVSTGIQVDTLVAAARARLPGGSAVGLREDRNILVPAPAGAAEQSLAVAGRQWTVSVDDRVPVDHSLTYVVALATTLLALLLGVLARREIRFDRARLAMASRLAEEARRAERLAEVGRKLSVARHLDAVVAVIEREVPTVFNADVADIGLLLDSTSLNMLGSAAGIDADLAERYRRVPLDSHLPTTQAVRESRMVLVEELLDYQSGHDELHAHAAASGLRSVAALPLFDEEGTVFGVIAMGWHERQDFGLTMAPLLQAVGDMCGQTLDRARDADRRHAFVAALQRRLLPVPPATGGLEIVARYRSATAAMGMGGDWYQFMAMPDGSTVIVVGDVIGHGVDAIAIMMQIQHVTAAMVQMGVPLPDVFSRVDTALGSAKGAHASALLLHVNPSASRIHYISAGHPYSLLRTPDGDVQQLTSAQYGLVGLPYKPGSAAAVEFPPGSILLAYTDGLVERRNRPITTGITLLANMLARSSGDDLDRLAETLIESALGDAGEHRVDDDVAVVLIRHPAAL
jgi:serine phosphatase RsbU (regulator of sigma subunit)/CHASE1-domain containing sensor protein